MKRRFRLAARFYPAWWRRRYGREFEALLEDIEPGWREFFNVVNGALMMRITTLGALPVVGGLAGAFIGGIVAMQTPAVYASSATLRVPARAVANAETARAQDWRGSLDTALGTSRGTRGALSVTLLESDSEQMTVKLTYLDRDPAQAQRVAQRLTVAVAADNRDKGASAQIVDPPTLPTSPVEPDYPTTVVAGGGVGLAASGVVVLLLRSRRRPARTS